MTPAQEITPELVERMARAIRAYVDGEPTLIEGGSVYAEFAEIAALLPAPTDPDLIEARKLAAGFERDGAFFSGDYDAGSIVQNILIALKRGRELARSEKSA